MLYLQHNIFKGFILMKKKLFFILASVVLASLALFALVGCSDMSEPNPITREKFEAAVVQLELHSINTERVIDVDLSDTAFVSFYEFDSVSAARTRFDQIDNSYTGTRSPQVTVNFRHNMARFNTGGRFVRIYRVGSVVVHASGLSSQQAIIDNFMDLIIIRD